MQLLAVLCWSGEYEDDKKKHGMTLKTEKTEAMHDPNTEDIEKQIGAEEPLVVKTFHPKPLWRSPQTVLSLLSDESSFVNTLEPMALGDPLGLEGHVEGDTLVAPIWTRVGRKLIFNLDYQISPVDKTGPLRGQTGRLEDTEAFADIPVSEPRSKFDSCAFRAPGKDTVFFYVSDMFGKYLLAKCEDVCGTDSKPLHQTLTVFNNFRNSEFDLQSSLEEL